MRLIGSGIAIDFEKSNQVAIQAGRQFELMQFELSIPMHTGLVGDSPIAATQESQW